MTQPFSTLGKIVAVCLDHSRDEIYCSVARHPGGMARLELPNGDEMIIHWDRITWARDLKDEEYDQIDAIYFNK